MYTIYFLKQCKLCRRNVAVIGAIGRSRQFSTNNPQRINELSSAYNPHELEKAHFNADYFPPKSALCRQPFSLILPPPNITGTLHLGHALTVSIQDALVKWHKMQGREVMWVPGLDHAGIATQVVVEKKLWKERGLTRHQLGRERFEEEIWKWKQEKSTTIIEQLRRINVDLSWDREAFTMDAKRSKAVTEAFIRLFEQGLIYRADHLVNWSCTLQSAVSDIEVDRVRVEAATDFRVPGYEKPVKFGVLTKFAYKLSESLEEIVVATTRPETILGDVAVAVNPQDSRYAHFVGKRLQHPFRPDLIPVIADNMVDPLFGTGAVKITPAHDPDDFLTGKRHNLRFLAVIDEQGQLTDSCGAFQGLRRFDAREVIIGALMEKGLYKGSQEHSMAVPICSRSKDVIEFLIKPQWFLDCSQMSQKALANVGDGTLQIEPENFEKTWSQWLENIRDWCISRQLWWGHRIPAYSCSVNGNNHVWVAAQDADAAKEKAARLLNCRPADVESKQDEDVLDTWFSSALQPFAVFGWPEQTADLDKYYPLSLMETGHDILFFWVARMVMLGTHLTGQLPFKKVLLHGVICDAHGRKMSKSLGNVIAPEEVIDGVTLEQLGLILEQNYRTGILSEAELKKASDGQKRMFPNGIPQCGADALRFTLLSHNVKSHVINFDVSECHTNKLFGNKIWQATKFTLLWTGKVSAAQGGFAHWGPSVELAPMDRWILSKLTQMLQAIEGAMEAHEFHGATAALKQFLYYEFCDVYLEAVKSDLKERTADPLSSTHCKTLLTCLDHSLRALWPFMPMLAQHLHQNLPLLDDFGLNTLVPKIRDRQLEAEVDEALRIITGIRRLKKVFNIVYKHLPEAFLLPANGDGARKFQPLIKDLSSLHSLTILKSAAMKPPTKGLVEDRIGRNVLYLVVPEELRLALEVDRNRTEQKKEKLLKELGKLQQKVSTSGYREKAPMEAKQSDARKIAQLGEKISRINYIQSLAGQ
ncbi:valine--tRNA ligase isoform X2 [Dendroctonus ponderosae]|uniref:valine--tRNA ligase isoform X2 n=1 Tax=Dendroctonus ponderosae TaxID=77166 RepID=UPI002034D2CA|nr:valine--tRNA ligase isoform X2 [Dendroctonus ponderosae]